MHEIFAYSALALVVSLILAFALTKPMREIHLKDKIGIILTCIFLVFFIGSEVYAVYVTNGINKALTTAVEPLALKDVNKPSTYCKRNRNLSTNNYRGLYCTGGFVYTDNIYNNSDAKDLLVRNGWTMVSENKGEPSEGWVRHNVYQKDDLFAEVSEREPDKSQISLIFNYEVK